MSLTNSIVGNTYILLTSFLKENTDVVTIELWNGFHNYHYTNEKVTWNDKDDDFNTILRKIMDFLYRLITPTELIKNLLNNKKLNNGDYTLVLLTSDGIPRKSITFQHDNDKWYAWIHDNCDSYGLYPCNVDSGGYGIDIMGSISENFDLDEWW